MDSDRAALVHERTRPCQGERGTGEVLLKMLSPQGSRSVVVSTASAEQQTPQMTSASPLGDDHVRLALNATVLAAVPGTTAERVPTAEVTALGS